MKGSCRISCILLAALPTAGVGFAAEPAALRFAWPDGATAAVHVTTEGRRNTNGGEIDWAISCDYRMGVQRAGDRIVVARTNLTEWAGKLPPTLSGGAERFAVMIPTLVVSPTGEFGGIAGHAEARSRMRKSIEKTGGLDPALTVLFDNFSSDAGMTAMAADDWSVLNEVWIDTVLDPDARSDFSSRAEVPQLGGGTIEILGHLRTVSESACPPPASERRCARLHLESAPNPGHVKQVLDSLLAGAGSDKPLVTAFEQQRSADILLETATMLPQELRLRKSSTLGLKTEGKGEITTETTKTTYVFTWSDRP